MGESVAAEAPVVRLETTPDGKIANFDEFMGDLKVVAEKEGINPQELAQKIASAAPAGEKKPLSDDDRWRQATMVQIQAKRAREEAISMVELATALFELGRVIPPAMNAHRQCANDKGAMIVETFVANIPDPRGQK